MQDLLNIWLTELRRYNPVLHLVSPAMLQNLDQHAMECLQLFSAIREDLLADIGSGSGLPAIPFKIAHPETHVIMLERSQKKCAFLERVTGLLGLDGLEVVQTDALVCPEKFPAVMSRAFSPSNELERAVLRTMQADGRFYYVGNSTKAPLSQEKFRMENLKCIDGIDGQLCLSCWQISPR